MIDKRFRLTMVALVLGWLLCIAGLTNQAKSNNENSQRSQVSVISGLYMVIGTYAYRSAKRRKLEIKPNDYLRRGIEVLGIAFVACHPFWALTPVTLLRDPFPLVVGLWVLVAYIVVNLRRGTRQKDAIVKKEKTELSDLQYDDLLVMARELGIEIDGWPSKDEVVRKIQEKIESQKEHR